MAQLKLTSASAETRELFCFFDQSRQIYTRVMASAPVFKCGGPCGKTREIHELGQTSALAARTAQLVDAPGPALPTSKRHWLTPPARSSAPAPLAGGASKQSLDETKRAAAARIERRTQRLERLKEKPIMPEPKTAPAPTSTPFLKILEGMIAKAIAPIEERLRAIEDRKPSDLDSAELVRAELERQLGLPLQHKATAPAAAGKGGVVHDHKKRCFPSCSGYGK